MLIFYLRKLDHCPPAGRFLIFVNISRSQLTLVQRENRIKFLEYLTRIPSHRFNFTSTRMEITPQLIRLFTILVGFGSGIYLVRSLLRQYASKHWPMTTGKILESTLEEDSDGWYPHVRYSYSIQGKSYASDQLYFYSCNAEPDEAEARTYLLPYPVGKAVTIYFNPRDPADAVLDTHVPLWRSLFWLFFTSFFLAIGAGMLA